METTSHRSWRLPPLPDRRILMLLGAALVGVTLAFGTTRPATAVTSYTIQDLGTLSGGTYSFAEGINDAGQVVGYSQLRTGTDINGDPTYTEDAFLWQNGQMQRLMGFGTGRALDINNTGQVVGYSFGNVFRDAVLWRNGDQISLDSLVTAGSGWDLREADAINDEGQITGMGRKQVGTSQSGSPIYESHAFLLTPSADTARPTVTTVSPRAGATGVSPSANVTAMFSEAMDPATLNKTTFKLVKKGTTTKVPATVSYSATTRKATLNPSNNLKRGATYKATVTTDAKDEAGNSLSISKSWSFKIRR